MIVASLVIRCLSSSLFVVVGCAVLHHAISFPFSCLLYEQRTGVQVDCCVVMIVCCLLPLWFVIVASWFVVCVVAGCAVVRHAVPSRISTSFSRLRRNKGLRSKLIVVSSSSLVSHCLSLLPWFVIVELCFFVVVVHC